MLFARRVEHTIDVAVQRSHKADVREHRRPAKCDQDKTFRTRGAVNLAGQGYFAVRLA